MSNFTVKQSEIMAMKVILGHVVGALAATCPPTTKI